MRVHRLSIFPPEPVGVGRRVRYGGGNRPGQQGDGGRGSRVLTGSEGHVVFPVAAIAGAGWLFLLVVLLIAPALARGEVPAAVTVSALTALISIHGTVHIASEASLAGLLPVVEGRLRELRKRIDFNQY